MSTTDTPVGTGWIFNNNYHDLDQIADLYPAYLARYAELDADEQYNYNSNFVGCFGVPFGPDDEERPVQGGQEGGAIYLCQKRHSLEKYANDVASLIAQGLHKVANDELPAKFARVVIAEHGTGYKFREFTDARVITDGNSGGQFVIPKGRRTRGYRVHTWLSDEQPTAIYATVAIAGGRSR